MTGTTSWRARLLAAVTIGAQLVALMLPTTGVEAATQNIWPTGTPANLDSADTSAVNLGVKFQSDTAGYINGIRFYKGNANNGGTHIGSLWSSTGSLIAQVTFTNESGTGWQDAQFNGSVAIAANTTYIASYYAPQSHYPYTSGGLTTQVDSAPLHALASGASGGNGVFAYAAGVQLPTSTFNDTNYWVDVDYSTTYTPPTPRPGVRGSGPVLVLTDPSNPFSDAYCNALLKTEGLPQCAATDSGNLTSTFSLTPYRAIVLADGAPLTSAQISLINTWVTNGGTFVAMKPNDNLDTLLGIGAKAGTLSDAYYKVNSAQLPGIETQSMQYHGLGEEHALAGATSMATLYSNANTATAYPAMTTKTISKGKAIAVMYDVSKSVLYLRNGNPALAGKNTVSTDGYARFVDRFGNGWLDTSKASIPQADMQSRILANVVEGTTQPRLWYFPSYKGAMTKAALVMTGDDHANNSQTLTRFAAEQSASPAGCSVADWTCYTSTSYAYAGAFSDAAAKPYTDAGFEVSPHVSSSGSCASGWTNQADLDSIVTTDINGWKASYPTINGAYPPLTERFHCYGIWNDYASIPKVEAAHGIKADTNSPCWPNAFLNVAQCLFTGTGMPMQYSDADGSLTGVYQFTTQATDENTSTVTSAAINGLLTNATGASAYYGYFTLLCHLDNLAVSNQCHTDALAAAQTNNVPMVSARQAEQFVDARAGSTITNLSYATSTVSYTVTTSARNLQVMTPVSYSAKALTGIKIGGVSKTYTTTTINGVSYAILTVPSGSSAFVASYR
jgi:hypothetical protein